MKRALVTGANGQLGSELKSLSVSIKKIDFTFIDIEDLNLTDFDSVDNYFRDHDFDYLINCAAYTNVDQAESNTQLADALNHLAPKKLAKICLKKHIKLIHISTDFVFDGGCNKLLNEEDKADPISVYGKTKLDGEKAIQDILQEHFIIRTSWLYSSFGHNFLKTVKRLIKTNDKVNIVADQFGTPTYAKDLAYFVSDIIENKAIQYGLYHYSNEGTASWYDFAYFISEYYGMESKISPIATSEYPTPAKRPSFSIMSKQKVKTIFGIKINHWHKSLKQCLNIVK